MKIQFLLKAKPQMILQFVVKSDKRCISLRGTAQECDGNTFSHLHVSRHEIWGHLTVSPPVKMAQYY